jgi:hypothetical protein
MKLLLDSYAARARLLPALLVALPVALAGTAWFPKEIRAWEVLSTIAVFCGLLALLAQVGRDAGKRREPRLFENWGGKPSTVLLRHSDVTINRHTKARYHQRLGDLLPDLEMPTAEEEQSDPKAADEAYDSCVQYLLQRTRDHEKYAVLFAENVNYGFRRNLWAMKPAGIALSGASIVAGAVRAFLDYSTGGSISPFSASAVVISSLLLAGWLVRITPSWVRVVAVAYAQRLLETCEDLAGS